MNRAWRAFGLLLTAWAVESQAADPVRGETLYLTAPAAGRQACAGCHGVNPFSDNTSAITRGRNSRTTITNAIANNAQMSYFSQYYNATDIQDIAAYLGNTPKTLNFGSINVGSTSASQSIVIYASTLVPLDLTSISISGDYAGVGGTCPTGGATLASGSSCTVAVAFSPSTTGTRAGSVSIAHGDTTTPVIIALSGSGTSSTSPAIAVNPVSLAFASQVLGTTSAAQTINVTNTGNAPLTFTSFTMSGSASADFQQSAASTCSTGAALAAAASCTLAVTFTPSTLGARAASLTIASNASNGNVTVSLTGNGVAASTPAVSLSASSVDFGSVTLGSSAPTSQVTLTNSGTATLNLGSITATLPFSVTHNCPSSLAAGSSCVLSLGFTPAASGTATGSVSITSDAASSADHISLTGTGTTTATSVLAWSGGVTSLAFGDVAVGSTSGVHSLTLTNQGPDSVTLQSLTVSGSQASDFLLDATSTCVAGGSIAAGASCNVVMVFRPSAAGSRSAALGVASSGTNPPSVALSGNGVSTAQPGLAVNPVSLTFAGPNAPSQVLNLSNSGSALLSVASIDVTSGPFTVAPASSNGCPLGGFDLQPGQGCGVSVAVNTDAAASGTLRVASNATGSPADIPLSQNIPVMTNIGAAGCSIARGRPDGSIDPTLWLLVVLAAAVLAWRARGRRAEYRNRDSADTRRST